MLKWLGHWSLRSKACGGLAVEGVKLFINHKEFGCVIRTHFGNDPYRKLWQARLDQYPPKIIVVSKHRYQAKLFLESYARKINEKGKKL